MSYKISSLEEELECEEVLELEEESICSKKKKTNEFDKMKTLVRRTKKKKNRNVKEKTLGPTKP
jgi:hypothetical protein